jgi:cysteinyl-tRNA synthetase
MTSTRRPHSPFSPDWPTSCVRPRIRRHVVSARPPCLAPGRLLGLLQDNPEQWFQQTSAGSEIDPAWVDELLAQRVAARAARDFARADEIRKTLSERGIVIEDGATGTRWRVEAASAVVP